MAIKKEFKIGIFVIVVLIATFAIINVLRGTDIFGREMDVKGYFDDVETLVASAPVMIRGFNAGRVSEVRYDAVRDSFVVTCSISKEFNLPQDSRMLLFSTSLMGGKGIKLVPGTSDVMISDGAVIGTGSELDLMSSVQSQIGPIFDQVKNLMDSLTLTVSNVNSVLDENNRNKISSTLSHLEITMANARKLSATLDGKSEALDSLLDNLEQISGKVVPLVDSASLTVSNLNTISTKLAASDIDSTIVNVNSAVSTVNTTLLKVQEPLENMLKDADNLIKNISENPKKYIKITIF